MKHLKVFLLLLLVAPSASAQTKTLSLVIQKVDANASGTTVSFRCYSHKDYWFRIAKDSYIEANGKKYKLTAADGIKLDEDNYTQMKASESTNEFLGNTYYTDFTLTFEPFDTIPTTFDFIEGDVQGAFCHSQCFSRISNYEQENHHHHPARPRHKGGAGSNYPQRFYYQ